MAICKWSELGELLMLLKSNLHLLITLHLLLNTLFKNTLTHFWPYSQSSVFVIIIILLSAPHNNKHYSLCLNQDYFVPQPVRKRQRQRQWLEPLCWLYTFLFSNTVYWASHPAWTQHQLAMPAGCPQTLEHYEAVRPSIPAAKPNRCTALKPTSENHGANVWNVLPLT